MDSALRQMMLAYYDERAAEYEEAYELGTGTSSIPDPEVFKSDAAALAGVVSRFGGGDFVDLACGTGYWLPHYAARCSSITFVDQSEKMLAQCRSKAKAAGVADRSSFIRADVLKYDCEVAEYNATLVGFLLSHLTQLEEDLFFQRLRRMLRPSGQFLILDSAWTSLRARFNNKIEQQQRHLNDGTAFTIYKRYLSREDIERWRESHAVTLCVEHFGSAMLAVSGQFARP